MINKQKATIYEFFKYIWVQKKLILLLGINDFKQRYSKSYLGLFWSYIQPMINIGVMWFVFSVGFRTGDTEPGIPFILWLICGLVPWYFFSEVFPTGTNVLFEYSYMLRQMTFKAEILPFIKIISGIFTHIFFIFIIFIVSLVSGFNIDFHVLQIIYYLFCTCYLLIGLSWLLGGIKVFLPDVGEIIAVILQLGFWITPIFWSFKMIPEKMVWIFKINPIFYIIQGYRDSFIYKIWFWEKPNWTLVFFFISSIIFISGAIIFRKLKPHFNDVL